MAAGGTRLFVLASPPQRGVARPLAGELGEGAAARLACAFLADTWGAVSAWVSSQPDVELLLAVAGRPETMPLLLPTPTIVRQAEGDLGRRIATLSAAALAQRGRCLLLGADSPGVPEAHLAAAVAALDGADVVVGPRPDGGIWCLGARAGHPALWGNTWLDDLAWTPSGAPGRLRAELEERVGRMGLKVGLAPEWFEVESRAELDRLRGLVAAEPDRAPETLAALAREEAFAGREPLSIVVDALNDNVGLDACLEALRQQEGPLEIVVADGGSTDRSAERAAARSGVTVVVTGPGRGRQLAAGAAAATGDALLFLRADMRPPPGATRMVREALARGAAAGTFAARTVLDPRFPNRAGPLLRLADLRTRWRRHPDGDQALFATRGAYEAAGGFRPLPVLEDYDLSLRLAAHGRLVRIAEPVQVSRRRMQAHPVRTMIARRLLPALFRLGVDPAVLARVGRRA